MRLDHAALLISDPDASRAFYCGVLGWAELPKPEALRARGGLWLQAGESQVHLGVEADFRPALKAHPAFVVDDLDALAERLRVVGAGVTFDDTIPGLRRFYTADAVGNRLEFLETQTG